MLCGPEVKILLVLPEMLALKAVPAISEELSELFWLVSGQSALGIWSKNGPDASRIWGGGSPLGKLPYKPLELFLRPTLHHERQISNPDLPGENRQVRRLLL